MNQKETQGPSCWRKYNRIDKLERQTAAGGWEMKEVKEKTVILSEFEVDRQTGLAVGIYLWAVAWGGMEVGSL